MDVGCLFAPTVATPGHIERAEALGYRRAYVYDSPAFLADPWMTLALAAQRTSHIALGVCAITPRLRHVVATAGALATLAALAPGRTEVVLGSGFTSQLMLAQRPARWAEVAAYAAALRALLAGQEINWDGALIGLKPGTLTGVPVPAGVTMRIAAHGPRGYAVADELGCGIVTNVSHRGGNPLPPDLSRVQVLYYGTVLDPAEDLGSARVRDAAGPYAAFQLHLGEHGLAAGTAERAAFAASVERIDPRRRHLEVHRGHLIQLTEQEQPVITPDLIARTTGTGPAGEVRARLAGLAGSGIAGVLYGAVGPGHPARAGRLRRCRRRQLTVAAGHRAGGSARADTPGGHRPGRGRPGRGGQRWPAAAPP
jgi:5,10-methylenetetrahydromethanopterin reductase